MWEHRHAHDISGHWGMSRPVRKGPVGAQSCMYKKMDIGERAAKIAELARQLGILEGLLDGPHAVADAAGPTTADAALFPTLVFCKEVRRSCIARSDWQAAAMCSDELAPVLHCKQVYAFRCALKLARRAGSARFAAWGC